jgi:hypothetical protein
MESLSLQVLTAALPAGLAAIVSITPNQLKSFPGNKNRQRSEGVQWRELLRRVRIQVRTSRGAWIIEDFVCVPIVMQPDEIQGDVSQIRFQVFAAGAVIRRNTIPFVCEKPGMMKSVKDVDNRLADAARYKQVFYHMVAEQHHELVARIESVSADRIDSTLPHILLQEWIKAALGSGAAMIGERSDCDLKWDHPLPKEGYSICVLIRAGWRAERIGMKLHFLASSTKENREDPLSFSLNHSWAVRIRRDLLRAMSFAASKNYRSFPN